MRENTVGIIFGTFAPLHTGHIDLITKAKRENERVIVIVSGYNDDRGDKIGLPVQKRFRYVREAFSQDKLVTVVKLDETNIPRYPDGWTQWLNKVKEVADLEQIENGKYIKESENENIIFYVAEKEYEEELLQRGFNVSYNKRNFGISATKIRNNPRKYWNYISMPFRRHFTTKVLIVGSASNGKTTLATDLGRFYLAPVSYEYARQYEIESNVKDDELEPKDFFHFLLGQNKQTSDIIEGTSNNGLIIADTNSTVTAAYYDSYIRGIDDFEDTTFDKLYFSLARKEKWDAIIFVEPTGKYIDDGFRDMTMAKDKDREKFSTHLKLLIAKDFPKVPIYTIGGDYLKNYEDSKKIINKLLNK